MVVGYRATLKLVIGDFQHLTEYPSIEITGFWNHNGSSWRTDWFLWSFVFLGTHNQKKKIKKQWLSIRDESNLIYNSKLVIVLFYNHACWFVCQNYYSSSLLASLAALYETLYAYNHQESTIRISDHWETLNLTMTLILTR